MSAAAASQQDDLDDLDQFNPSSDATPVDSTRMVTFATENADGTETPGLHLPDRSDVEDEFLLNEGSDTVSDPGTAAFALWVASGEDPITAEKILDQLEAEILDQLDGMEIKLEITNLITDDIRVRLRLDAQQAGESELRYIDMLRSSL